MRKSEVETQTDRKTDTQTDTDKKVRHIDRQTYEQIDGRHDKR